MVKVTHVELAAISALELANYACQMNLRAATETRLWAMSFDDDGPIIHQGLCRLRVRGLNRSRGRVLLGRLGRSS